MLKEKDVDRMLEVCFNAVERLASYLEDHNTLFDEIETDDTRLLLNKIFHTLGASVGNFLYTYQDVAEQPELVEAFKKGLRDYISYCQKDDIKEFDKRPTRLIDWVIDNEAYKN